MPQHLEISSAKLLAPFLTLVLLVGCHAVPSDDDPINPPTIASFTADPPAIAPGESSTLSWEVANAESLTLDPGVLDVGGRTSLEVSPAETTVYTLTAVNAAGSVQAQVEVVIDDEDVGEPPVISSFTADPPTIVPGESSTLSWEVANAESLRLDPGAIDVTGATTWQVSPTETMVYTLTASNPAGAVQAEITVTVESDDPVEPPTITSFTANPPTIAPGESSMLSWSVSNADSLILDPGAVEVTGLSTWEASPTETTVYTLTAVNPAGSAQEEVTVTVESDDPVEPPVISSFSADPPTIVTGASSTLSWEVANAESLRLDPGAIDVTGATTWQVSPTQTTVYTLTAVNAAGSAQAEAEVTVEEAPGPLVLETVEIARNLPQPTFITHAGDGTNRLFITLQEGRIRVLEGESLLPRPFLDINSLIASSSSAGLYSMAFHPNYASNGFFFVNYLNRDGNSVIARYRVSEDPNVADSGSARIVLTVEQPLSGHYGGQLQFGPDGFLYIGMGDGSAGRGGDPNNYAQDLGNLLGAMLRIDVDSGEPYAIPESNPFVGVENARDEIWAYGFRNPWRFSFDRLEGDLFIADVGEKAREEVNFQPANSNGGENYGWRRMEGSLCFNPPTNCNDGSLTLPIIEYDTTPDNCSITGGYRYRGSELADLYGSYLYGDFCSGRIWGATPDENGRWTSQELLHTGYRIVTFGEDEAGEIYIGDYGGAIYRLIAR
jgi:glucose/arabinose dehydrogenase